jgi:hypothetical protein
MMLCATSRYQPIEDDDSRSVRKGDDLLGVP